MIDNMDMSKLIRKKLYFECPQCYESFTDTVDCWPSGKPYEYVYCPYCDYLFNPDEDEN